MRKIVLLVVFIGLVLSACAQSPFEHMEGVKVTESADGGKVTEYGPGEYQAAKLDGELSASENGCREWVQEKEKREAGQYDALSDTDKAWALAHRETMRMVSSVWGKGEVDICKPGSNQWDAYIAYVKEHNETVRSVAKEGFGFGKHATTVGGVVVAVDDLAGAVGDRIAGDKVTSGRDTNRESTLEGNSNNETIDKSSKTQIGEGTQDNRVVNEQPVTEEEATPSEESAT